MLAGIAAIAVVSIAPANAAELTMAPVQKAPRPVPARLGQFSGSVVDPLGKGGSEMLETESKFKKRTSAKRAGRRTRLVPGNHARNHNELTARTQAQRAPARLTQRARAEMVVKAVAWPLAAG